MDVLDEKKSCSEPLTFMEWLQRTFTDQDGIPSFKRQLAFVCFILFVFLLLKGYPNETIEMVAWMVVGLAGVTSVEKLTNRKL